MRCVLSASSANLCLASFEKFGTEQTDLNHAVLLSSVFFAFMHLGYFSADDIRALLIGMASYVVI